MRGERHRHALSIARGLGLSSLVAGLAAVLFGAAPAKGQECASEEKPAATRPQPRSDKARAIVEQLRPDVRTLVVYVTYVPKKQEPQPNLELYSPLIVIQPGEEKFHITDEQCRKIFDWLVADGYFERARELLAEKERGLPVGPYYDLTISVGGQSPMYHASIGWDQGTISRLKALRSLLDGPPTKAIDAMIEAVLRDLKEQYRGKLFI